LVNNLPLYSIWSIFIFLSSLDGKTPLLYAAEAGHDQIVAYLLQFREVCTDLKEQPQRVDSASVRARLLTQATSTYFISHFHCSAMSLLQMELYKTKLWKSNK